MSIVSLFIHLPIVGGSIYLLVKTRKTEAVLLTIGSSASFLISLFYTFVFQFALIEFDAFPTELLFGVSTFFNLLFAVGFLLIATRLVKEREDLMRNDFQKRQ